MSRPDDLLAATFLRGLLGCTRDLRAARSWTREEAAYPWFACAILGAKRETAFRIVSHRRRSLRSLHLGHHQEDTIQDRLGDFCSDLSIYPRSPPDHGRRAGSGRGCRLLDESDKPYLLTPYLGWLFTQKWRDSAQYVSGDAVWYAALRSDSTSSESGTIIGFVQSRYLKLKE